MSGIWTLPLMKYHVAEMEALLNCGSTVAEDSLVVYKESDHWGCAL